MLNLCTNVIAIGACNDHKGHILVTLHDICFKMNDISSDTLCLVCLVMSGDGLRV